MDGGVHLMGFGLMAAVVAMVSFPGTVAPAQGRGDVALLKDGKSGYRIVLNRDVSPSERHAARELQQHFLACTGVTLPIAEGLGDPAAPAIVLGCGEAARSLGVAPTAEQLGEQGFILRTTAPHLVIAGTREAGPRPRGPDAAHLREVLPEERLPDCGRLAQV